MRTCEEGVVSALRRGGRAVQRVLKLVLGVPRERRLENGPAEAAEPLHCLVRRDLLDDHEQRRRAGLDQVTYLILELPVDAGLLDLAEQRAEAGSDRHAEHGDEEEDAEKEAPEH